MLISKRIYIMDSSSSLLSRVKSMFSIYSLNTWLIVGGIIVFIIIAVTFYNYYISSSSSSSSSNPRYNVNNEGGEGGEGGDGNGQNPASGKTAELMFFFANWCPHCKTAMPIWENLKADHDTKLVRGYKIIFTEVDCTEETPEVEELMNRYKIEGYPTIKLLKDGQVIEYDAKPTKENLEKFLSTVL
jgi:thiol-disulfide isomerase/thioredoxin